MTTFKFIDLFSGIGGFHQAMKNLGGECVFASEIDKYAIETYQENYRIDSNHDITKIEVKDIPEFDVLCAGFPCQPFSIAGKQEGFLDKTKGTLFFEIARILEERHPKYFILENVKNLVSHNNGDTYNTIKSVLKGLGYRLTKEPLVLSPHQFGIPQSRERLYIVGLYEPTNVDKPIEIKFDKLLKKSDNSIYTILENTNENKINAHLERVLECWDEFYKGLDRKLLGFTVQIEYFNDKTYPYTDWREKEIKRNQELYKSNKTFIDSWLKKWNNLEDFTPTQRKFEWCCKDKINSLYEGLIQIRQSGVRVKTPDVSQTLVAIVQTPIVGKYKRYLTVRETARLQSFPDSFIPNKNEKQAYKQFGNAVNVKVVQSIAEKLFEIKS